MPCRITQDLMRQCVARTRRNSCAKRASSWWPRSLSAWVSTSPTCVSWRISICLRAWKATTKRQAEQGAMVCLRMRGWHTVWAMWCRCGRCCYLATRRKSVSVLSCKSWTHYSVFVNPQHAATRPSCVTLVNHIPVIAASAITASHLWTLGTPRKPHRWHCLVCIARGNVLVWRISLMCCWVSSRRRSNSSITNNSALLASARSWHSSNGVASTASWSQPDSSAWICKPMAG